VEQEEVNRKQKKKRKMKDYYPLRYNAVQSVDTQRTTRHYIVEYSTLHNHRRENLKSYQKDKNKMKETKNVENDNNESKHKKSDSGTTVP
jgi:hypothetical protein